MSGTDKVRIAAWTFWGLTVLAALVGWWLGKDPSALAPVVGWITLGAAAGEASNVGKRMSWKKEAAYPDVTITTGGQ